ncbi:MAG: 60S ribosomal export protein NMD3 [Halodesulfurarchaeum sp.]
MTTDAGTFCPRCGDPVDPDIVGEIERGLCTDCYLEDFELLDAPETVEVTVCARCGAVKRGDQWVDVGARDLTEVAIEEATEAVAVHREARDVSWTVEPEQIDRNTIVLHASFSATVRDRPIDVEESIRVSIGRGTCRRCGRIAGNSYASVVQVRASDREPRQEEADRAVEIAHNLTEELEAKGDREAFVTEVIEEGHGPDIKLSTTKLGRRVAMKLVEEFGGSMSDSETLVTEDRDGNEVYRVTYAVRLPAFRPGDIIEAPGAEGPVLVQGVRGNLKGVDIKTGEPFETNFEDGTVSGATKIGSRAEAMETAVVSVPDEHAVQVLDPETSATRTVARPVYFDPDVATVEVFRTAESLYVLPAP